MMQHWIPWAVFGGLACLIALGVIVGAIVFVVLRLSNPTANRESATGADPRTDQRAPD